MARASEPRPFRTSVKRKVTVPVGSSGRMSVDHAPAVARMPRSRGAGGRDVSLMDLVPARRGRFQRAVQSRFRPKLRSVCAFVCRAAEHAARSRSLAKVDSSVRFHLHLEPEEDGVPRLLQHPAVRGCGGNDCKLSTWPSARLAAARTLAMLVSARAAARSWPHRPSRRYARR